MARGLSRNVLLAAASAHEPSPMAQDSREVVEAKQKMRKSWKWAFVSHFICVFEPMLNLAESMSIPVGSIVCAYA